jgi:hypothetical protein
MFAHPLLALVVAILLSLTLFSVMKRRGPGPGNGLLFFFVIFLLFAWAGGIWMLPYGPMIWGTAGFGFLLVPLLLLLVIAALLPSAKPRTARGLVEQAENERAAEDAAAITLGAFFWATLILLVALIAVRYVT